MNQSRPPLRIPAVLTWTALAAVACGSTSSSETHDAATTVADGNTDDGSTHTEASPPPSTPDATADANNVILCEAIDDGGINVGPADASFCPDGDIPVV